MPFRLPRQNSPEQANATLLVEHFGARSAHRSMPVSPGRVPHASPRTTQSWKPHFKIQWTRVGHRPTPSIENALILVNRGLATAESLNESPPATALHDCAGQPPDEVETTAQCSSYVLATASDSDFIEGSVDLFFTPRSTMELEIHGGHTGSEPGSNFPCPPLPGYPTSLPWILESYRRVDSPTLFEIHRENDDAVLTLGELSEAKLQDICNGVRRFTHTSVNSSADSSVIDCPEDSTSKYIAQDNISRKILVIGSNYTRGSRRTFSVSSAITLEGAVSDKNIIKDTFTQRGYSGHSLVNDSFDKEHALNEVSRFLSTARCGDVRAIVFTGHAISTVNSSGPALVPPNCPARELAIPAHVWEKTIRDSAKPGVIVLSIFASCFSGGFMQQPINIQNLDDLPSGVPGAYLHSGPILVTFSSTSPNQLSYESSIERTDPWRVADHFLHALSCTAQSSLVNDWASFVSTLALEFQAVRDVGGSFDPNRTPEQWQTDSPQSPMLTASSLPDFPTLFPELRRAPHSNPI